MKYGDGKWRKGKILFVENEKLACFLPVICVAAKGYDVEYAPFTAP